VLPSNAGRGRPAAWLSPDCRRAAFAASALRAVRHEPRCGALKRRARPSGRLAFAGPPAGRIRGLGTMQSLVPLA